MEPARGSQPQLASAEPDSGTPSDLTTDKSTLIAPMAAGPSAMSPAAPVEQTRAPVGNQPADVPEEAIVGLLALLGLGAVGGFLAMSRRRKPLVKRSGGEAVVDTPEPARATPEPVAATPLMSEVPPMAAVPPEPAVASTADDEPMRKPRSPQKAVHLAALEQMSQGPVPTGKERADLLRSMTAAPPDKYNPFTSPKARRRRARLILQHRERLWEERENQTFDWRTYEPSMKKPQQAEPMVAA